MNKFEDQKNYSSAEIDIFWKENIYYVGYTLMENLRLKDESYNKKWLLWSDDKKFSTIIFYGFIYLDNSLSG